MKRTFKMSLIVTLISLVLVSCGNDKPSLQRYFVDHQESANFSSVDLPVSMLNLDDTKLSKEQKEAYKSVRRLNFLGFKLNEANKDNYQSELNTVKTILKAEKYQELIEFQDSGNKFSVKYLGDDDKADEVIVLGSSSNYGFGVFRLLGDDMKPEKIYLLVDAIRHSDVDTNKLKEITNFFK